MIHNMHRLLFFPYRDSPISNWGTCTLFEKRKKSEEEVNAYTGRYHLLQSGGCWYAAGTPNSPFFHILLISPIFLPTLHFSEPFCHSCATLSLCFSPLKHEDCSEAVVLPRAPGLCWFPAPLKRLVTQASGGPRVWKLLIEDRSQPGWHTQGRFSVFVAVCCSCLCGGLRESVQLLGAEPRQWAIVITCHSSQYFLSLPWPSPAKG